MWPDAVLFMMFMSLYVAAYTIARSEKRRPWAAFREAIASLAIGVLVWGCIFGLLAENAD
jgi:hypothetical protein